jgi:hypothetical protein
MLRTLYKAIPLLPLPRDSGLWGTLGRNGVYVGPGNIRPQTSWDFSRIEAAAGSDVCGNCGFRLGKRILFAGGNIDRSFVGGGQ